MKKLIVRLSALALVGVAGLMLANTARAAGGGNCLDVYAPVICSNGVVYSNACYANPAKAKNCRPYGND